MDDPIKVHRTMSRFSLVLSLILITVIAVQFLTDWLSDGIMFISIGGFGYALFSYLYHDYQWKKHLSDWRTN